MEDIHAACWRGDISDIKSILESHPERVNLVDNSEWGEGFQPIHYTAYRGFLEGLRLLLKHGASPNSTTEAGCTPLFYASQQGHKECVEELLRCTERLDKRSKDYDLTALDVADETVKTCFKSVSLPVPAPPRVVQVGPDHLTVMLANPSDLMKENRIDSVTQIDLKIVSSTKTDNVLKETSSRGRPLPLRIRVRDLSGGASCKLSVRYCSAMGISEWSPFTDTITLETSPRDAPTNFAVLEIGRRDVRLSWDRPNTTEKDITGYVVEKRIVEGGHWEHAVDVERPKETNVRVSRLFLDTSYEFRVAATNRAGTGVFSKALAIRTRSLKDSEDSKRSPSLTSSPSTSSPRKSRKPNKNFRWSFSQKMIRSLTNRTIDGETVYNRVFDAGDLDKDGFWNIQEFNLIQNKMEHDPVSEAQFRSLCIQVGDDPKKGLTTKYLHYLCNEHGRAFLSLFGDTARALGVAD